MSREKFGILPSLDLCHRPRRLLECPCLLFQDFTTLLEHLQVLLRVEKRLDRLAHNPFDIIHLLHHLQSFVNLGFVGKPAADSPSAASTIVINPLQCSLKRVTQATSESCTQLADGTESDSLRVLCRCHRKKHGSTVSLIVNLAVLPICDCQSWVFIVRVRIKHFGNRSTYTVLC